MKRLLSFILALALVLSVAGCAAKPVEKDDEVKDDHLLSHQIAAPEYPKMAKYPDETAYFDKDTGVFDDESFEDVYDAWRESRRAQHQSWGYAEGLDGFFTESIRQLLSGSEGENKVYSPLNVYMALAMLAEVTDGDSRSQILDLLGSDNIDSLRAQAKAIWNANYCDDGAVTSILASSLWLNQDVSFVQSTMDSLAENYYASSFKGKMGSDEFNAALQGWLNQQTGGLLEEQASDVTMDPETVMALATTIYFRAKWANEFNETATSEDVFHAPAGDVTCDFMNQGGTRDYYWGEGFSAVSQRLEGSGGMWFILPDEGVSPDELLESGAATDFILAGSGWSNSKYLVVNLSVPKFDVVSDTDLLPSLKALGVTDVLDPSTSDFTPMTDIDGIFISQAKHAARVTIDEEGCTAAAYTVMMMAGAAMPPDDEIDFVVDRPFIFAITGEDGLPLFVGVVNQPA